MKHSFVLKTIALILCAVSLFGIVASGFGIYVLTEMGLYSKTVPQLREDQIQRDGAALAQTIALRYASTTLGGAPTGLVTQELPSTWNNSGVLSGQYGYVLMDNQGNVLDSLGSAEGDNTTVVRFPVTGQYIHLVSLMTEREKYPSRFTDPEDYTNAVLEGDLYLYEAVPPEGAVLYAIYYRAGDDFSSEVSTGSTIGTAYYLADGFLACLFTDLSLSFPENTTITDVTVVGADGTLLYEASSVNGVGYFTRSGNQFLYVSTIARRDTHAETVPETTAETTPETVPETTAETVPETTPETVPETTEPAVTLDLEDNLPDSGMAEVVEIYAELDNGDEVYHVDEYGVGRVTREEDGTFTFSSYDSWEADTGKVLHIVFLNADGDVLFEASCDEGVGELYLDDNKVCFRSDLPVIPEPTVPETTAETVPPTTAPETVPATEAETEPEATVPDVTEPILINGRPLAEMSVVNAEYYDFDTQQNMHAAYVYIPMPEYTVELYLTDASFTNHQLYYVLELLRSVRTLLLPLLIVSIILTLGSGIYLLIAAGHGKDGIVRAGGLNKTPLDLYLLIIALSIPLFLFYALEGGSYLLRQSFSVAAVCAIGFTFAACLLTVSFLFAAAAQLRTPGGFWWRNTLVAHSFRLLLGLSVALEDFGRNKLFPKISRFSQKLWYVICRVLVWMYRTTEKICIRAGSAFRILFSRIGILLHKFLSLLPLTWQWLLIGFLMFLLIGICITTNGEELLVIMCLCLSVSLIVYGAHCFGTLLDSTKKMRKGNLDTKVDDKLMVGAFKEFAGELNELASVAVVAAQKQLNSERMKSELITNVSHDI
ncbi:MAG: hypothetical protein J6V25_01355, partial [Oscillospiraceae bacterium]|nr:hypothetical protein [Oscillospiraceae bacterium]